MVSSVWMTSVLRSMTSVALAIWMAVLACLVGCGQMFAQSHASADFSGTEQVAAEMPACHHSHSSTPIPQKKQDSSSVSCCLPDAISQKSNPSVPQVGAAEAPVPSVQFHVPDAVCSVTANPPNVRSHRGRDTLLKTSLLRI